MATYRVIRNKVLDHLDITRQALSGRVKTIQQDLVIDFPDSVRLIGIETGAIRPDDLEDDETRVRINDYYRQRQTSPPETRRPAKQTKSTVSNKQKADISIANTKLPTVPGLSDKHIREAKLMSEDVYPVLYVFENSARDLVARVLQANLGSDWWESASWSALRSTVRGRMKAEGKEAWHSARGDHPLQYVDLGDLADLVAKPKNWPFFEELFPRENWFEGLVDDLGVSRNVIAHMNPISRDDVTQVHAGYARWAKQLKAIQEKLP